MAASPEREDLEQDETAEISPRPRLVFTQAPILLAKLLAPTPDADGWRVRIGSVERTLAADDCVDPVLLRDAAMRGARVIVDATDVPTIVGVVTTQRALVIDEEGDVRVRVRSLEVDAEDEVLLKTPGAFLRAKKRGVELYGDRVVTRARDLVKILAAMIKLN